MAIEVALYEIWYVLRFYKCSEYRAWIVGEKTDFRQVNVFFVDYGNTSTLDRRMTSLTSPYIWETKPILQPFTISGNAQIQLQGHLFGVLCLSVCLPAYLYDCMIFNCLVFLSACSQNIYHNLSILCHLKLL